MQQLKQLIFEAEKKRIAIGHFNISDIAGLKAIFKAAQELNLPVIIGVSEGESGFVGMRQTAALIKSLREEFDYPIFLNSDHTHSLEKIKEAVEAGFDAVLFDGGKLPIEENIQKTKEVVDYVKSVSASQGTDILVEGELGYLGGSSKILTEIPKDASINKEDLTKPEQAEQFVKETGIDLLAPAIGNIHGMFKNVPNPNLNIKRIKKLREAAGVPLVLHGGSGIRDEDFLAAIDAGISTVHINTELRLAWRKGIDAALKDMPEEITPYKILPSAVEEIKKVVEKRMKLFNKLD
ncbi:MAG TPA: class II fructose-bisphosphate aldolase [Candidatus Wolfebacteria bacterium]|nr:class II fructose-bisphosphate aldolase [Candidatus Wolfebacteria bacterium]